MAQKAHQRIAVLILSSVIIRYLQRASTLLAKGNQEVSTQTAGGPSKTEVLNQGSTSESSTGLHNVNTQVLHALKTLIR